MLTIIDGMQNNEEFIINKLMITSANRFIYQQSNLNFGRSDSSKQLNRLRYSGKVLKNVKIICINFEFSLFWLFIHSVILIIPALNAPE